MQTGERKEVKEVLSSTYVYLSYLVTHSVTYEGLVSCLHSVRAVYISTYGHFIHRALFKLRKLLNTS